MGETCGGCKFHSFPYKACLPISVDGKRQTKTFKQSIVITKDIDENEIDDINQHLQSTIAKLENSKQDLDSEYE